MENNHSPQQDAVPVQSFSAAVTGLSPGKRFLVIIAVWIGIPALSGMLEIMANEELGLMNFVGAQVVISPLFLWFRIASQTAFLTGLGEADWTGLLMFWGVVAYCLYWGLVIYFLRKPKPWTLITLILLFLVLSWRNVLGFAYLAGAYC